MLKGTVNDDHLEVRVEGIGQQEKKNIPWDKRVLGLYGQERLFQVRNVQPGDRFSFLSYEPIVDRVVTNQVTVKDFEEIEVFKVPKRLLRVQTLADKIVGHEHDIQSALLASLLLDAPPAIPVGPLLIGFDPQTVGGFGILPHGCSVDAVKPPQRLCPISSRPHWSVSTAPSIGRTRAGRRYTGSR